MNVSYLNIDHSLESFIPITGVIVLLIGNHLITVLVIRF